MDIEYWANSTALMLAALLIEAGVGWPDRLYRLIAHPTVWIGALVSQLERWLNQEQHSAASSMIFGAAATLIVLVVVFVTTIIAVRLTDAGPMGFV
ncbi:MAG: cobalamin biosynthesis protein, partial [Pseudomonadota bacterium]